ncbi:MAG: hypothetical protein FJZ66_03590 [Bacteroidetes bacterium]|nr:hypothetical protein [Bacteroidota bacterium]
MDLIRLIFQLGVLFAIYSFIWFFIDLGLALLMAGRKRSLPEIYLIKAVKYLFLVNVTFMFALEKNNTINILGVLPSATILVVYFLGKLQQKQRQASILNQFGGRGFDLGFNFNQNYEIGIITFAVALFFVLLAAPQYAENNIAIWFRESIIDIEETIIIGFIFKIIGAFFLLSMIIRMINAFFYLIFRKPLVDFQTFVGRRTSTSKKDDFDDFEEIPD